MESMKKIGLGLIGLGTIGHSHLRNCLQLKTAELVAVADVSKKALASAKEMGVRTLYENYEALLSDKSVDAVIIALPTFLHCESIKKAAEAGKDILIEKPLARNVPEAKDIVASAEKGGVKLMVGYPFRFYQDFVDIKRGLANSELGDIQVAYATHLGSGPFIYRAEGYAPQPVPQWWFNKELTGGGALIDSGCHMINLFHWYFGEIEEITSFLGNRFNLDFEDQALCIARFKGGPSAIFNIGWFSQQYHVKVDLFGTVKNASAIYHGGNLARSGIQMLTMNRSDFWMPYMREVEHFVQSIRNDSQPLPSGYDGLRDTEAIFRAYENNISFDELSQALKKVR